MANGWAGGWVELSACMMADLMADMKVARWACSLAERRVRSLVELMVAWRVERLAETTVAEKAGHLEQL